MVPVPASHALGASPEFGSLLGVNASCICLALVARLGKASQDVAVLLLVVRLFVFCGVLIVGLCLWGAIGSEPAAHSQAHATQLARRVHVVRWQAHLQDCQKIFDGELKGAACTCSLDICNAHSLLGRLLGNISVGADSDGYTSVICVPMKFVQLSLSL